jgi:hypothetical protein
VVAAFLNLRSLCVNEGSNTWKQMTLSNGRALTGAPPAYQRGYRIVPADAVPHDATVEQSVGDGAHVSVAVPYPTLASINQVVRWADASGFDGIVAHDVFDLGPEDTGRVRASSTTVVALRARQIARVASLEGGDPSETGVRGHRFRMLRSAQRTSFVPNDHADGGGLETARPVQVSET